MKTMSGLFIFSLLIWLSDGAVIFPDEEGHQKSDEEGHHRLPRKNGPAVGQTSDKVLDEGSLKKLVSQGQKHVPSVLGGEETKDTSGTGGLQNVGCETCGTIERVCVNWKIRKGRRPRCVKYSYKRV